MTVFLVGPLSYTCKCETVIQRKNYYVSRVSNVGLLIEVHSSQKTINTIFELTND